MMIDIGKVDIALLTKQRQCLRTILDEGWGALGPEYAEEYLEGINNLLDHIHDQLVPIEVDHGN